MNWKIIKQTRMFDGHFKVDELLLEHDAYRGGALRNVRREIVSRQNAVAVVPYDPLRDTVVLTEQFRVGAIYSSNPWLLEIVAGLIEEGEAVEEVARRETLEEIGCEIHRIKPVATFFTSPGGVTEHMTLFVGEVDSAQVTRFAGMCEEHEDIQVVVTSVKQIAHMLDEGEILSATPLIGLQWLLLHQDALRREWGFNV
jgi:ADP-ribose pyrophosphatase